jgi:uncharacterized protein (DUF1501 family)
MLNRRQLLKQFSLGALAAGLPGFSLAKTGTDARLVLVILRGAADGLAMLAPYGEGKYDHLRGELALPKPGQEGGVLKADGLFGIHPSFSHTHQLFQDKQALFVHAVASPYRKRSHFDAQDVLEAGFSTAGRSHDGWLNRALKPLVAGTSHEIAIAMAANTPLVLRGDNPVTSWAPSRLPDATDDTISRIQALYANDEFLSTRLSQALDAQNMAGDMQGKRQRGNNIEQMRTLMRTTARFLAAEDGPRVAVLESGGWDTHANQGSSTGNLSNRFAALDQGLAVLQSELAENWNNTVVVVATEFGRTVRVNGTRGTDHGTATAALLAGGAVNGGRVIADWPGLSKKELYEDRDLYPSTDIRSVFKGILGEHMGVPENWLETGVFPDSRSAKILEGLVVT